MEVLLLYVKANKISYREKFKLYDGHPYGRSGGVSTSARVDPGLVRAELGQLFDTRWLGLNRSRNACPVRQYRYRDG